MNYTFFGPIFPFDETFDRMDARDDIDFWGITAHKEIDPNPFPGATGVLPRAHPVALDRGAQADVHLDRVRAVLAEHADDHVATRTRSCQHESKFTQHFARARASASTVAFDPDRYPSDHPVFESAVLMLDDRCPLLKRRIFFHEPTYLDRNAILGKRVMEEVATTGYPHRPDLAQRRPLRGAAHALHQHVACCRCIPDVDTGQPARPAAADLRCSPTSSTRT